jgi:hypothetical protein
MKILVTKLWKLDVKTDYYCIYENCPIWELGEFGKIQNLQYLGWLVSVNHKVSDTYLHDMKQKHIISKL